MSAVLTTIALALVVTLCFALLYEQPFNPAMLERAAAASSIGIVVATLLAAYQVKRVAGGVVPLVTLLRVLGAMVVSIGAAQFLPAGGKLSAVLYAPVIAALFVVVLVVTRELGKDDLALIQRVTGRR
jgi:stage V sporulation protein B